MKKLLRTIILNLLLILFIWVTCDFVIYKTISNERKSKLDYKYEIPPFKYMLTPNFGINFDTCFENEGRVMYGGRKPDGEEFKNNSSAITIFGCSFASGQFLDTHQTLSYKLAQALQCPVHNRALPGKGLQHMYLQSTLDSFYKTVPPSDNVIYIMIDDHYRRMMTEYIDVLDTYILINYAKNGDKLEELNYKNPFRLLFNSSYLVKLLKGKYITHYINNSLNEEEITDKTLCHFVATKNNLKEHWGKDFKFTILFYDDIKYENTLRKKLIASGFDVISTQREFKIEKEELKHKYSLSDGHPNEDAWNLMTPLIVERLNKK